MMTRDDLVDHVYAAVRDHGGRATIVQIAKHIWQHHERQLRESGDLFFTWQYDMRWAAQRLRDTGKFRQIAGGERGIWEVVKAS
jgi:hypothetical protein